MIPDERNSDLNAAAATSSNGALSIEQCAGLACLLEAIAPKPGNVHRGADFDDLTFTDFAVSAFSIAPTIGAVAAGRPVGHCILQAVRDTRQAVGTNTNLGIVLLFYPLAAVPRHVPLEEGIDRVLADFGEQDAIDVYQAIRLAKAGGLGRVDRMDIADRPPADLCAAMRAAADRDLVARQYTNRYHEVLQLVVPWLVEQQEIGMSLSANLVRTHLRLMSGFPDSLIARKCGSQVAQQASDRAAAVLDQGGPGKEAYHRALADLDFWLRSDRHRRNPGTTADVVTAGLFAALREGVVTPPFR